MLKDIQFVQLYLEFVVKLVFKRRKNNIDSYSWRNLSWPLYTPDLIVNFPL